MRACAPHHCRAGQLHRMGDGVSERPRPQLPRCRLPRCPRGDWAQAGAQQDLFEYLQAKVERVQQTVVRNMVGKWKTATGRADFHTVLPQLVDTYNNTVHSVTKGGGRGEADDRPTF